MAETTWALILAAAIGLFLLALRKFVRLKTSAAIVVETNSRLSTGTFSRLRAFTYMPSQAHGGRVVQLWMGYVTSVDGLRSKIELIGKWEMTGKNTIKGQSHVMGYGQGFKDISFTIGETFPIAQAGTVMTPDTGQAKVLEVHILV